MEWAIFSRRPTDRACTSVVYQYRSVTGYHIVRVDDVDGEVAHLLGAGVAVHADDVEQLPVGSGEPVAGSEIGGVDPLVGRGVPERVIRRGVQDRGWTVERPVPGQQEGGKGSGRRCGG